MPCDIHHVVLQPDCSKDVRPLESNSVTDAMGWADAALRKVVDRELVPHDELAVLWSGKCVVTELNPVCESRSER